MTCPNLNELRHVSTSPLSGGPTNRTQVTCYVCSIIVFQNKSVHFKILKTSNTYYEV